MLNRPVQASVNQTECLINQKSKRSKSEGGYSQLLYQKSKQERTKRKDQSWRRLATVNKIAQKAGYNLPDYSEKRTITELLKQHGEYSYLTGKKLGTFYLSTLDIDIRKEEFAEKLIAYLEKSVKKLLDYLRVSYDKTKKGLHVDILTPKPLDNGIIYWVDKLSKKWTIGSIQSKGKYVVGEDKEKVFINNGKWYWKTKSNEEVKITLNKFFFYLNNQEKPKATENSQLLVNEAVMREHSLIIEKPYKKPKEPEWKPTKRQRIQAQILSKKQTNLEHMWKVFYLDWKTKTTGYFLLNDYHRKKDFVNLDIGSVKNMVLVQGRRHSFFSKLL